MDPYFDKPPSRPSPPRRPLVTTGAAVAFSVAAIVLGFFNFAAAQPGPALELAKDVGVCVIVFLLLLKA